MESGDSSDQIAETDEVHKSEMIEGRNGSSRQPVKTLDPQLLPRNTVQDFTDRFSLTKPFPTTKPQASGAQPHAAGGASDVIAIGLERPTVEFHEIPRGFEALGSKGLKGLGADGVRKPFVVGGMGTRGTGAEEWKDEKLQAEIVTAAPQPIDALGQLLGPSAPQPLSASEAQLLSSLENGENGSEATAADFEMLPDCAPTPLSRVTEEPSPKLQDDELLWEPSKGSMFQRRKKTGLSVEITRVPSFRDTQPLYTSYTIGSARTPGAGRSSPRAPSTSTPDSDHDYEKYDQVKKKWRGNKRQSLFVDIERAPTAATSVSASSPLRFTPKTGNKKKTVMGKMRRFSALFFNPMDRGRRFDVEEKLDGAQWEAFPNPAAPPRQTLIMSKTKGHSC